MATKLTPARAVPGERRTPDWRTVQGIAANSQYKTMRLLLFLATINQNLMIFMKVDGRRQFECTVNFK
jgi:hypothetical protein